MFYMLFSVWRKLIGFLLSAYLCGMILIQHRLSNLQTKLQLATKIQYISELDKQQIHVQYMMHCDAGF